MLNFPNRTGWGAFTGVWPHPLMFVEIAYPGHRREKSAVVQWLGYLAFTQETRVQTPAAEPLYVSYPGAQTRSPKLSPAGNRTRADSVAGSHSTTPPPPPLVQALRPKLFGQSSSVNRPKLFGQSSLPPPPMHHSHARQATPTSWEMYHLLCMWVRLPRLP